MLTTQEAATREQRERTDTANLERAMRAILKLFADGHLAYRERRTIVRWDVAARASLVRGLR